MSGSRAVRPDMRTRRRRDGRRSGWLTPGVTRALAGLLIVLAVVAAGLLVHPAYVVLRPGPAVDTLGNDEKGAAHVRISGARTYPTTGSLYFTTVAQYGGPGFDITGWDLVAAYLDPQAEVVPRDELYPPQVTREQVKHQTAAEMSGSQHDAVAVALRALGRPERAVVREVLPGSPAAGVFRTGDVVLSVDGTRIRTTGQIPTIVQQGPADRRRRFVVRRGDRELTLQATPRVAGDRKVVGIALQADFPGAPKVDIDAGQVGGPSAGTMFALAVYDRLTPGALTGGQKIAGTGTIGIDGAVGPIGGVRHKMVGARDDGARWFLAPAGNCDEVTGAVPRGLSVARVSTFDEARHAVEEIGAGRGDALPTCATPTTGSGRG